MKIKGLSVGLLSALVVACASKKKVTLSDVHEGNWKAKTLITDKEGKQSQIVYLNFNAVRDQHARMDVTTIIGTGVASLVVDPAEVRYFILDSKKFYVGVAQPEVMRPILPLPFNPKWIHNILFEEEFTDKGWTCQRDAAGLLSTCQDANTKIAITWSARKGPTKSVTIDHPRASVQINVQAFKPAIEDRKNLFVLEAPVGFQKLRIR